MRRTRRILIIFLAALVVLYVGYWFVATSIIRGVIEDQIQVQQGRGVDIAVDRLGVGGFPFDFAFDLDGASIVAPTGEQWRGGSLSARTAAWSPTTVALELRPGGELTIPLAPDADVVLAAADGDGEVAVTLSRQLRSARIALRDVAVSGGPSELGTADSAAMSATDVGTRDAPALAASGELLGVDLPDNPLAALGTVVDRASVDVTVTGPLPQRPGAAALAAWRDAGGTLLVDRLELAWGPLEVSANGTLALDDRLQPAGRLTVETRGHDQVLQALVAAGLIGRTEAFGAAFALNALSGPPDEAGVSTLTAPLSIQGGQVLFGNLPLGVLPEIAWPP